MKGTAAIAAALVLALPLAACSDDDGSDGAAPSQTASASADATRTPEKPLPAPENGTCHRLDYAAALEATVDNAQVGCGKPHTSRTIKVGELDSTLAGHFLAVDSAHVSSQPAAVCGTAFEQYVGGTPEQRRLTMLSVASFSADIEESDQGANWVRCDLVSVVGPEQLGNLPGPLRGVLDTPEGRDTHAMCGTAKPGADDFTRVACSQPHTWRATASVDVPAGAKGRWPGKQAAQQAGQERCKEAARGNADDALNYDWGYEWPDRMQWRAGRTYGFCWAPD